MQFFQSVLLRLLTTLITLVGVAVIVFFVIRVVPGNPIAMMLPPGATEADVARLTALYGLDKTIPQQFLIWLSGVLQGDFGTSITTKPPVLQLVLSRLPATLELSVMALIIAILIGGFMALTGTRLRGTKTEAAIDVGNGMALSVPDFLWGADPDPRLRRADPDLPHLGSRDPLPSPALHLQFLPDRIPVAPAL